MRNLQFNGVQKPPPPPGGGGHSKPQK